MCPYYAAKPFSTDWTQGFHCYRNKQMCEADGSAFQTFTRYLLLPRSTGKGGREWIMRSQLRRPLWRSRLANGSFAQVSIVRYQNATDRLLTAPSVLWPPKTSKCQSTRQIMWIIWWRLIRLLCPSCTRNHERQREKTCFFRIQFAFIRCKTIFKVWRVPRWSGDGRKLNDLPVERFSSGSHEIG